MILKHQHFDLATKIAIERVVFQAPVTVDAQMHNEACFLYSFNSPSKLYSVDAPYRMAGQEGVVMKCGNYLQKWHAAEDEASGEAIAVHFYPEILKEIYQDKLPKFLSSKPAPNPVAVQGVSIDPLLQNYIQSLRFHFEHPELVTEEWVVLKVKELVMLLAQTENSAQIRQILQDLFNPTAINFKDVIQANLYEDLSVQDLAMLVNMSESSFKRKFKEIFQDSPAHYIKSKRLARAAELLVVSDLRVTDICYDCGFNDVGHFSKSFSGQYGCSPSQYRERRLA
ncbi:AraC family transcriptional regulator [Pontibacter sp. G13]|uniref:helix-turn-helix domain-containing protein n=1 Tax=Pontibacter sp. G13 TaxID=3074898 RepID=UPI002889324A|nr:AraC family transcriptional regulator [Pontibacter sp. G13]WNJ17013.1 AraC family transcriptional regulator [Pontibacter sp. G13]